MEEDIIVKESICSDSRATNSVREEEKTPVSDPLELPSTFAVCQGTPIKRKIHSVGISCEPESQHLKAICLNIRIAIIRCFYSSSSCPTSALQKLKEEDNALHVTINVEDINFFVQKFEKTGSVIGNQTDTPNVETEDAVNPHTMVETIFDSPFENSAEADDDSNDELYDPMYSPYNKGKKRKKKAPLVKRRKKDQPTNGSEIQQPPESEKKKVPRKRVRNRVKTGKMSQKFPPLGKNECRICKKKCPDRASFTYHFLSHFNMTFLPKDGPHTCPACHKNFARNYNLYDHLFNSCRFKDYDFSQKEKNSESSQNPNFNQNLELSQNLDFAQNSDTTHDSSLISHSSLLNTPNEEGWINPQQSSSIQEPMEQIEDTTNENISTSQDSKKQLYKCPRCSVTLPDMRSLTYHVLEHFDLSHIDGDPPYKCPECDGLFREKRHLYKHLVVTCHKGLKWSKTPFECHICKKAFQFEIQLEHHLLVHSGKAKLKECNFCGKKFNTTTGFRYHLVSTHAEKKAHQCDQCPRYFTRLKLLEEHKLSHSGTYLYVCEICGKNCDTSSSFKAHLNRHSEKPRWQCDLCGKDYSGRSCYKQHMRTHTGEIVAVCDLCGKGFTHKGNLKIHYKSCQRQFLGVNS